MRRPTSDVRQRESRRSSLDNVGSRRRNSSVPFHSARIERNPNSLDSDTDFLCDRAVEFMESGDIHSIVAVELAEQSMYFERLLRYHKGRGYIRLPEFLNSGFASVLEFIRKGTTELTPDNVYHIFIAADYLLVPKLKQECASLLKDVANDPATAIALWLSCRALYWPEVGTMAFQKLLENFEIVWPTPDFQQLEAIDVWRILQEDGLNCKREKTVFDAIVQWINVAPKTRLQHALDLLLCVRIGMLDETDLEQMKNAELIKLVPDYLTLLQEWPTCLTQTENPMIVACGKRFITPRLPHEVCSRQHALHNKQRKLGPSALC
ncbi:Kelch protein [Fasciolopsis buskii]|uniref:Kelch protein n=1 Tax=Fasciolopsis buskii TaxID=27845 RepID=A0A8E0VH43_9TREM|nr:Kelch protein [Fasciolopsis buski]